MYEVYFDDSGTHRNSEVAIAACYVSTKRGWDSFVDAWDDARVEEGFDVFHMADFVAPRERGHKPFCDWDNAKKDHVYDRLAKIINENKRIGIACGVPKKAYDEEVPDELRIHYGREHYAFAVRKCLMSILEWRESSQIILPMRYVFDWEMSGSGKRAEISAMMHTMHASWRDKFGLEPEGFSFERKEEFKPLQAADILAWQMNNLMRRMPNGEENLSGTHPGFIKLRNSQHMDLGFFTPEQLRIWVKRNKEFKEESGFYL
ncbi:MAG TPA: DUF3800 domain-containing protein [Terriglobales bacterium]|nr:DUF3800 domain-containing protein [Terriglobales bacterium]